MVNGAAFVVIAVDKKPLHCIFFLRDWIYSLNMRHALSDSLSSIVCTNYEKKTMIEVVASNERQKNI